MLTLVIPLFYYENQTKMKTSRNPELELAEAYVKYTDRNVFLTGKAGTGKTTFLHKIRKEVFKRHVVLAPTGVAAINAAGMTLHSFFQLPFGLHLPGAKREESNRFRMSRRKLSMIRNLDLLIIDEISMVRADMLDAVDEALRRHRRNPYPFGGVQLLLIGDLHQLPPIVKEDEWELLARHYDTPFFFSSRALREAGFVPIQLQHIYRQQEEHFISLLNKIRKGHFDDEVFDMLNSRYRPDFTPAPDEGYITLTTHNAIADDINQQRLAKIQAPTTRYKATIEGNFPEHAYPADPELELKPGAQVMFIKNDPSPFDKRYFNGKIGYVTRLEQDCVYVQCPGESEEIPATPLVWDNVKYEHDPATNTIKEEVIGSFEQIPLRLAWAVTIHKSQGLTFDKVIIDAEAAFAHGQVYVALSRCRTFEGVVLRTPIRRRSLHTDSKVQSFSEESARKAPSPEQLRSDQARYQEKIILELLDFRRLKDAIEALNRSFLEHSGSFTGNPGKQLSALAGMVTDKLLATSATFGQQLKQSYFTEGQMPEEHSALQERLRKAGGWYASVLSGELLPAAADIRLVSDNRTVLENARKQLQEIEWQLFSKKMLFEKLASEGFSVQACLQTRIAAEIAFEKWKISRQLHESEDQVPTDATHPDLYRRLLEYRQLAANRTGTAPNNVLPAAVINQITSFLPITPRHLRQLKGFGKKRFEEYGPEVLKIVMDFCKENGLSPAPPPENTREHSLRLFEEGMTVAEIAGQRGLQPSTILGHLAGFVEKGRVPVHKLIDQKTLEHIQSVIEKNPEISYSELKARLGDDIGYGEIRAVQAHLRFLKQVDG